MARSGSTEVMTPGETLRPVGISGWCGSPSETDGMSSHDRCSGGNRANPGKEFSPCKCSCHYPDDLYECGGCGKDITVAPLWPLDEDGEERYTHIDPKTGRATGEDCLVSGNKKKREEEPEITETVVYEPADPIEFGQTGDTEFDAMMAELDEDL